jgi:hypothetical protein
MHSTSGITIFTGSFRACSSAYCRRRRRIWCACSRSTVAIGMPRSAAWTSEVASVRSSGIVVRAASPRSPSARRWPIWISWSIRVNSRASGPGIDEATCAIAASKPNPASTERVSRSSASGRSRRICACRWVPMLNTSRNGSQNPASASTRTAPTTVDRPRPSSRPSTAPTSAPRNSPIPCISITRSGSQPAGLPAYSSRRWSQAPAPFGVRARPTAAIRRAAGPIVRDRRLSLPGGAVPGG